MQHFESAKHGEMRVATRLVAQCDKECAVPQQDHVSKQCESPECECMQHFESAKHGEMRVATRLVAHCDKECAVLRQDRAALRHYLGL